jgi:ribosomal protein S18 acetylase RimI-like enzyme
VYDVEVRPEHRRAGHGRAIMLAAEDVARAEGAESIALNVFGHNHAARALYEDLGYETISLQMRKPLR